MKRYLAFVTAVFLAVSFLANTMILPAASFAREVDIPVSSGLVIKPQANSDPQNQTADIQVAAPSVLLMEASTGQVIYEKNADEQRSPASITKIMTLILIFDALEAGRINLEDQVVTSAHAKSMGGSQVFLEDGDIIGHKL